MDKQEKIERLRDKIDTQKAFLQHRIDILDKRCNILAGIERKLKDPHALIPVSCNSFEEWIKGHPFPDSCICNIYENKYNARSTQYVCNTYQIDYYVVKCKSREFYKEKYIKKNEE
jgi:hypothetical protein